MSRNSRQIKWMPAYKTGDHRIIEHYRRALGKNCDSKRAASLFKQDCDHYWRDPEGSRIQYDKLTDSWRGREVALPGPKFGVVRDPNPKLLSNILIANLGNRYWTKAELKVLFAKLFGPDRWRSKFKQAQVRKLIKFSDPVWHLATTAPPGALYDHKAASVPAVAITVPEAPISNDGAYKPAKSPADLEKERFDAEIKEIELLAEEKWKEHQDAIRELEREKQAREDRLFKAAEPLKYYPGGSDFMNLVEYISTFCDLSEFGWTDVYNLAKGAGYLKHNVETGFNIGERIEAGSRWDGKCWRGSGRVNNGVFELPYESSEPYWAAQ